MNINSFMIINVIPQQKPRHRDGYENKLAPCGLFKCLMEKNFYYRSQNLSSPTSSQHDRKYLYWNSGDLGNIEHIETVSFDFFCVKWD